MKIAVTGATGNIGNRLTRNLLQADADVTLLCRSPEKVTEFTSRGAKAAQGSQEDADYLIRATQGIDLLFWLTAPSAATEDFRGYMTRIGENAVRAIKTNKIGRVVNLSSAGAQIEKGAGPISGLHDVEQALNSTEAHVLHLRPSYFFENTLFHIEAIKTASSIFMPVAGSVRMSMVATQDIGDVAAQRILEPEWTGKTILGVHGPADLSLDEVAQTLSEVLGREIQHVKVPPEQVQQALSGMGMSDSAVETMLEMYKCWDSGSFAVEEPRTAETTTPTTFEAFARGVIKPMVLG